MIGVAVIGYGYWGPNLVRNFWDIPGANLIWVCDLQTERLGGVRRRYPAVEITEDVEQVLNDPRVDAVAIATPVSTHFSLAMRALKGLGHLAIVGAPAETGPLFRAAKAAWLPETALILVDPAKPIRNPDLSFPALDKPAAFLCGRGTCSAPFMDAERLAEDLKIAAR